MVLARASRGCYVDPVLPFPYLGLLVAYLCWADLGLGQADQQAAKVKLQAETSSAPQRLGGYGDGQALGKALGGTGP